jgi:hypothetical protein
VLRDLDDGDYCWPLTPWKLGEHSTRTRKLLTAQKQPSVYTIVQFVFGINDDPRENSQSHNAAARIKESTTAKALRNHRGEKRLAALRA